MKKISAIVEEIIENDDLIKTVASKGILNAMAYARSIKLEVEEQSYKDVELGSITTAVNRYLKKLQPITLPPEKDIQQITVQTNLAGLTYERSEAISEKIRSIYNEIKVSNKMYITITQGINEITIIAETSIINIFRQRMDEYICIYDISNIVGVSVKFDLKYMEIPNLFYALIRKLALRNVNIIEIVSTATELTFIINKKDMQVTLEQLQRGL